MRFDHIALNAADPEALLRFYRDVIGLEEESAEEWRRGEVPFPSLRVSPDTLINIFPPRLWRKNRENEPDHAPEPEHGPGFNHFCLALDRQAWTDLLARLDKVSVGLEEGPVQRWGARGMAEAVYFRDPENNKIEARTYEPAQPAT
ncbi:VOC family protein [Desulfohalovibrio reitneri]|uniref:VOC family protein n=1 Tax=Desulfohalovibrio reitneri TaxID=1307759 RepID=UPI0004A704DC|nr:VOC family protein [Desulfohalovibrio reitneri]